MRLLRIALLGAALLVTTASTGLCVQLEELYLYPYAEYFTWREFTPDGREVKEDGPIFGVGGAVKLGLLQRRLTLKSKLEVFGGAVRYDGFSQLPTGTTVVNTPSKTDTVYVGVKVEEDAGIRIPFDKAAIEPLFGLGYRWWRRDIQRTKDFAGKPVGETVENWQSLYMRLGARADYQFSPDVRLFAEGGAKYPLLNRNHTDAGVTVDPGGAWSAFAELGLQYGWFRPSFFYEGFRFARSPGVPVGGGFFVLQPESKSDLFGLNIGFAFR
jgi:hypothetical protein